MSGKTTKRRRVTIACNRCRSQKLRCDGAQPECGRCVARQSPCEYPKKFVRANVSEEYVKSLELSLERIRQQCGDLHEQPSIPPPTNPVTPDGEGAISEVASPTYFNTPDCVEEKETCDATVTVGDNASENGTLLSKTHHSEEEQSSSTSPLGDATRITQGILGRHKQDACGSAETHVLSSQTQLYDSRENELSVESEKSSAPNDSTSVVPEADTDEDSDSYSTLSLMCLVDVALFIDRAEKAALHLESNHRERRKPPHEPEGKLRVERIPCVYRRQWELPSYDTAKKYVQGYFKYEYTLYPFIHQPSFLSTFESYYRTVECCRGETSMKEQGNAHNAGRSPEDPTTTDKFLNGSKLNALPVTTCQTACQMGFYEMTSECQRRSILDADTFFIVISLVLALGYLHLSHDTTESSSAQTYYTRAENFAHSAAAANDASLLGLQASLLEARFLQTTNQYKKCLNIVVKSVGIAYELGLNREPKVGSRASISEQNLCRRLWYGCLMMDRSISLILRMPMLISWNYQLMTPKMLEDEYVSERTSPEPLGHEQPSMLVYYQQTLKLYKILADAFRLMCRQRLTPVKSEECRMSATLAKLLDFDERLGNFRKELPAFLKVEKHPWQDDDEQLNTHKQAAILHIRYLHVVVILGFPILLPRCDRDFLHDYESHWNYTLANNILRSCLDASSELIGILWKASDLDVLPSVWDSSFYVHTAAILILAAMLRQQKSETELQYSSLDQLWTKAFHLLQNIQAQAGCVDLGLQPLRSVHQKIVSHSATLDDVLALEFMPRSSKDIWGFDISCLSTLISRDCTCR